MTKQLEQLLWTLNLHKCNKNFKKNRNGIQNQIEQKKLEKLNELFLIVPTNIKPNKVPLQLEQWKLKKTMSKS